MVVKENVLRIPEEYSIYLNPLEGALKHKIILPFSPKNRKIVILFVPKQWDFN